MPVHGKEMQNQEDYAYDLGFSSGFLCQYLYIPSKDFHGVLLTWAKKVDILDFEKKKKTQKLAFFS